MQLAAQKTKQFNGICLDSAIICLIMNYSSICSLCVRARLYGIKREEKMCKILIPQHTEFVRIIKTLTIQQIKSIALLTSTSNEPVIEINELTYSLFLPGSVTVKS